MDITAGMNLGMGFSQWGTTLQCNVVSHWLSLYPHATAGTGAHLTNGLWAHNPILRQWILPLFKQLCFEKVTIVHNVSAKLWPGQMMNIQIIIKLVSIKRS